MKPETSLFSSHAKCSPPPAASAGPCHCMRRRKTGSTSTRSGAAQAGLWCDAAKREVLTSRDISPISGMHPGRNVGPMRSAASGGSLRRSLPSGACQRLGDASTRTRGERLQPIAQPQQLGVQRVDLREGTPFDEQPANPVGRRTDQAALVETGDRAIFVRRQRALPVVRRDSGLPTLGVIVDDAAQQTGKVARHRIDGHGAEVEQAH